MREIFRMIVTLAADDGHHPQTVEWLADEQPTPAQLMAAAHPRGVSRADVDIVQVATLCEPLEAAVRPKVVVGATVDFADARINELDRDVRGIKRSIDSLAEMVVNIANRLQNNPMLPPVARDQIATTYAVEPIGEIPMPTADGVVPPTGNFQRYAGRGRTEEMNGGDADPSSGSMGIVGLSPTSSIEQVVVGSDGNARVVRLPPAVVGDSLKNFRQ